MSGQESDRRGNGEEPSMVKFRRTQSQSETSIDDDNSPSLPPPLTSASRSQSWTNLMRKKSIDVAPSPPSPAESSNTSDGSLDTVTPAPARKSLISPSTYYRPAARLFGSKTTTSPTTSNRLSISSPIQSSLKITPITPPSDNPPPISFPSPPRMNRDSADLDARAQALLLQAIDRTKGDQQQQQHLSRSRTTESNSSPYFRNSATLSPSPTPSPHPSQLDLPPIQKTTSSSSGWTSVLGFSRKDKDREKSHANSDPPVRPPSSDGFFAPKITRTTSHTKERPLSLPVASLIASPQVMNSLRTGVPTTIVEGVSTEGKGGGSERTGVPLNKTLTMESTYSESEQRGRRGSRSLLRSAGPFNIFRSRSRNTETAHPHRDPSPAISALQCNASDYESDGEVVGRRSGGKKRRTTAVRHSAFERVKDDTNDDSATSVNAEDDEGDETSASDDSDDDEDEDEDDDDDADNGFDPVTEQNTTANAYPTATDDMHSLLLLDDEEDYLDMPDPLGEGVNVVRPEEPLFAKTLMGGGEASGTGISGRERSKSREPNTSNVNTSSDEQGAAAKAKKDKESKSLTTSPTAQSPSSHPLTPAAVAARTPRRKRTLMRSGTHGHNDPLTLEVSRPVFARDRCTVVVTHGDPSAAGAQSGNRSMSGGDGMSSMGESRWRRDPKRYVVFSDLSEESKWAVEWGIGTVLRDGDEMILVTVQETESKLDPVEGAPAADRLQKLRNQQERQALASLLVRQATSLLQRTKLNIIVTCQALHAKNARRLFLDVIDLVEPTMVIVGSRGLNRVKGILLGSTSHYLIQKSSVPVMVARRRLKRPKSAKKSHTAAEAVSLMRSKQRVALADAQIEKTSSGKGSGGMGVGKEVLQDEDERAEREWPTAPGEDPGAEASGSEEEEESPQAEGMVDGRKVRVD